MEEKKKLLKDEDIVPHFREIIDKYYKIIFDLITSISLICKKNYTTDINNTISLPKKRLTIVERSKK